MFQRWLSDYLHKNPIETSGARCDSPKRMHRRRIEALRDEKFKCKLRRWIILVIDPIVLTRFNHYFRY